MNAVRNPVLFILSSCPEGELSQQASLPLASLAKST
jgi:hypothetical protein